MGVPLRPPARPIWTKAVKVPQLMGVIIRKIKVKGSESRFVKVERGKFTLNVAS